MNKLKKKMVKMRQKLELERTGFGRERERE